MEIFRSSPPSSKAKYIPELLSSFIPLHNVHRQIRHGTVEKKKILHSTLLSQIWLGDEPTRTPIMVVNGAEGDESNATRVGPLVRIAELAEHHAIQRTLVFDNRFCAKQTKINHPFQQAKTEGRKQISISTTEPLVKCPKCLFWRCQNNRENFD